jgi:hypothetical protein
VVLAEELLVTVNMPAAAPAAEGSNCKLSVAVWPGLNDIGNAPGVKEKPAPVTVAPLMVTVAAPVDMSVTVCVSVTLTRTFPKDTLAGLAPRFGSAAFNSRAKVSVMLPALAVSVTACAVETGDTYAVNCALVVFACTKAAGEIVTAALLLDRPTLKSPARAVPLSVTVQRSVPVPTIEALTHEMPVSCGSPVPLRAIVAVALTEELLVTVN